MENNNSFTIESVIREGWELTKVNIGFLVVYQIILFFLTWLFGGYSTEKLLLIYVVGTLLVVLGKIGFYNSALLLTRGLKPSFDQFYIHWRLLFTWIVASLLFGLMFAVGLIFLIVPGLYVWAVFGFYPFFILDQKAGPIESLKKSAEATKGFRGQLMLLCLAFIGLNLLGLLFFVVGLLITIPVTLIAMSTVYQRLTGQSKISIQPNEIIP